MKYVLSVVIRDRVHVTTLYPSRDKAIEAALVQAKEDGTVENCPRYSSLADVERDLREHGNYRDDDVGVWVTEAEER